MRTEQMSYHDLWKEYHQKRDMAAREELLKRNVPLVRFTIERMPLPQNRSWLDMDDLMTAGIIGLIDAVEKFNPEMGGKFSTYAFFRIRGSVLDEMRAMDWVPRSVRQKSRELEQAYEVLGRKLHREVTEQDLAKHFKMSPKRFQRMLSEIYVPPVVSLDELWEDWDKKRRDVIAADINTSDRTAGGAFTELAGKEARELLGQLIERLPEKERLVLTLYYYEELTLKEIAEILEVTESRICQIHGQAIIHLRAATRAERMDFVIK
ncbi:FliA/WhiG family RNA polymerase sigma factor [candidate division FCPU426 bacterium]|nr:FliA/WhiG family RNA polymerase sigma factor [candidate division FCPU426 bacterium]